MAVLKYLDEEERNEIINQSEIICDKYCKYPATIYDENEMNEICETCPLTKVLIITGATE